MSDINIPEGHKKCSKCHEILSLDFFTKDKNRPDGYHSSCAACKFYPEGVTNKECNICHIEKDIVKDFYAGQGCCKECYKLKQKNKNKPVTSSVDEIQDWVRKKASEHIENSHSEEVGNPPTMFCKGRCQKNVPATEFHKNNNTTCRHCVQYEKYMKSRDIYWFLTNLYKRARERAKKCKLEFSITIETWYDIYFKQKGLSALSGKSMTHCVSPSLIDYEKYPNNISPDRKKSNIGYTADNVHFVRWIENSMKNDLDEDVYFKYCCEAADFYRSEAYPLSF